MSTRCTPIRRSSATGPGQQSVYLALYYPHNYHFLAFASAFAGRSKEALTAAAAASEHTPVEVAQLAVEAEYLVPASFVYLATYGRWDDILALPLPPDTLHAARGMALYARGSALAAKGRGAEASGDARHGAGPREGRAGRDPEAAAGDFRGDAGGEHRAAAGNTAKAIVAYQRAAAAEDGLPYMEPAFWHHPTRLTLGAALIKAQRAKEAAAVYRAVLAQYPESGEALYGLSKSLEASGGKSEAAALEPRIAAAWSKADIPLADAVSPGRFSPRSSARTRRG